MVGKKMNKTSRKKTIAVVFVALMVGVSIGTIILYAPPLVGNANGVNPTGTIILYAPPLVGNANGDNPPSPALPSTGETASVSTGVQYYKPVLQSNSTKQTTFLFSKENSTYSNTTYYDPSESWTISSTGYVTSTTFTLPSAWFWGFSNTNTVQLQDLAFMSQYLEDTSGNFGYSAGNIIYVNLTPASGSAGFVSGASFSWSTTSLSSSLTTSSEVVYVNPSWNIYYSVGGSVSGLQAYGPMDVTISLVYSGAFKWSGSQDGVVTSNSQTGNVYSTQTTLPVATNVPYAIGYNYPPTTVTLSFPSTMTSAQIVTENPELPMDVTYNGITEAVPYTFTAIFSVDTLKFSFLSTNTIDPAISVQYYLGSLYEAASASTTETASPSYTYTQVSGTTNEASASFSFTASIPSNDVFADYAGSLTTTFSPSVTVTNPYYSYAQNDLVYSGSGSSTVHGSSSNIQNPSFSFSSYSETSSNTPSWSVSMNLYGNVAPSLVSQNVVWAGTSDTAILYFNVTQPEFSGEPIGETINWGDGNTTTVSPTTTYNIVERHTYSSTGTYEISVVYENSPDPVTLYNVLSSLSATSPSLPYVISISPTATPAPYSTLEKGQGISISFSTTHDIVNAVTLTINGESVASYSMNTASGSTPTYYPSSAGQSPITAVWHFDGASYTYSVDYGAPEYPSINSPYITTMYGSTATDQYPITINSTSSGYFSVTINSPPLGTGDYQQLINITDPSQYGINTAHSNFQFVLSNGTLLYAWIEDANSSVVQVWVKMPFDTSTIYLHVFPTFENVLNATGYTGEAPQLSPTYAEYDNGANVFLLYFNGNTPLSDFNDEGNTLTQSTATFNGNTINVINITGYASQVGFVYTGKSITNQPIIAESSSQEAGDEPGGLGSGNGQVSIVDGTAVNNAISVDMGYGESYFSNEYYSDVGDGNGIDRQGTANTEWHYASVTYYGSSASSWYGYIAPQLYSTSGGYSGTVSNNPLSSSSTLYLGVIGAVGSFNWWQTNINWMRARVYVPEMPTTSIGAGTPSSVYFPITINSPPLGTGDYQQLINITDPSQYGINTAHSNFQFVLSNDTLLYAWIQNANSSVVQVWVKMPFDTPTIYLQVLPASENVLNATGYTGEAPQLSPTYAEYDNGAKVFIFYDNFAGTSLNTSKWVSYGSVTVSNGVSIDSSSYAYIITSLGFNPVSTISDAYVTSASNRWPSISMTTGTSSNSSGYFYLASTTGYPFGYGGYYYSGNGINFIGSGTGFNAKSIVSQSWQSFNKQIYADNYSYSIQSFSAYSFPSQVYYGAGAIEASNNGIINITWFRVRTYVPEMPTTSIGAGSYSPPSPPLGTGDYQQLINITDPSQYGINTAHSNFQFALPNDTLLYAWIQNANSSVVQAGVKMPINTPTIYLQVLPMFENVLSAEPQLSAGYGKYDIGSGSAFLANATQFTHDPYSTVANYAQNPLDEIYTYNVYDSFNSNYITLLANASWQFYGSSGYSKWNPAIHALTFYNVSGIGEVSASFIEPSQEIGQPAFISLSLTAYSQSFYNGFSYTGNYTPYGSTTPRSFSGTSSSFELPFGSTANLTILNEWDQPVYSITGLVINQTTMPISIDLDNDITIGTLQFVNTTASQVMISANGVSQVVSGYLPVYLKNNSQYVVSASIYDPSLGHNVNYSVDVSTHAPSQTIWINATAPLAELQLYANAYSGSQIGELSSSGSDMVIATINGQPYDLGSTFVSFVGKSLNVRIATVLNQTLYNGSILLTQPFMSTTINIQTPSWNFQLKNNEQVYNTSSPLATETVKITDTATNYTYTTTDMVGQLLSLYLASEPYHIFLHDNLTYSANFTLNNNTYWILFGQQLLTVGEYDAKISQIYSNTAGLSLLPINAPAEIYAGQKNVLQFELYFANGTTVTGQQLNEFLANSTLSASNSTSTIVMTPYVSGNVIYANLTILNAGSYTVRFTGGFSYGGALLGAHASYPLTVLSSAVDDGLHLYISGPTSVLVNTTATFYLQFEYSNGSSLSASSSTSLLNNITVEISGSPLTLTELSASLPAVKEQAITRFSSRSPWTVTELSPGDFIIKYMPVFAGSYLLTVSGSFKHNGVNLTTSSFYTFYTSSATNELIPVPVDTPASALANISMSYVIEAAFPNGTLLTHAQLATLVNNSAYSMENSKAVPLSLYVSGNDLYINFTLPTAGYYTLTLTSYLNTPSTHYSLVYSATITGAQITPASRGLEETISIPGTIMVDNATTGTIIFALTDSTTPNGATPTESQTKQLLANTTLELLYNGKFVQVILPLYAQPGTAVFEINESKVGTGYTVLAYTQSTTISGQNVSFTGSSQAFTVSSQNPASPPTPVTAQSIESFLTSPAALLVEFLATIAGIIAWIKPKIRAKHEKEEQDLNQAALGVEAGIALKILGGQPLTASEQAWWAAIPEKTRKDLMREGTAGQRVRFPSFSLRQNKANGAKK